MTKQFQPRFTLTPEQAQVLSQFQDFLRADSSGAFVLTGAAGTGKTTLVHAFLQAVDAAEFDAYLCAPTGRAANILQEKTGKEASTVHKLIYRASSEKSSDNRVVMERSPMKLQVPGVFLVDEASMLSDEVSGGEFVTPDSPLADLISHVRESHPGSKLVFVGDPYQLPPVNSERSPALSSVYLQQHFELPCQAAELLTVLRQAEHSPVLASAQRLRGSIQQADLRAPRIDWTRLSGMNEACQRFAKLFRFDQPDSAVLLAWRNTDVHELNTRARQALGMQGRVCVNDILVLNSSWFSVQSRYSELLDEDLAHNLLLSNGDRCRVTQLHGGLQSFGGLNFQELSAVFFEETEEPVEVRHLVCLELLEAPSGRLTRDQSKALFAEAMRCNTEFRANKHKPWKDRYVGAMPARFGYALTCHKAQGGEWNRVFLHPHRNFRDLRWLYTAITRAREEVLTWE